MADIQSSFGGLYALHGFGTSYGGSFYSVRSMVLAYHSGNVNLNLSWLEAVMHLKLAKLHSVIQLSAKDL